MNGRSVQAKVSRLMGELPESQRKLAELVLADPEAVAFGTTASVAESAGTSAPTVVRFAVRLGFDGYGGLRDAVRDELSAKLRSAAERIRHEGRGPLLERALEVERTNVERTFAGLDPDVVETVVGLLSDPDRAVWILPSSQMSGMGQRFSDELSICRERVRLLEGSEFRIRTRLAGLDRGDLLVSFDVQRHEAWLVRTQHGAVAQGAVPVAVTDRLPCSLHLDDGFALTFSCETTNPFESQVGAMAVANVLISAVVERHRPAIADRLANLEKLWVEQDLFSP